STTGPPWPCSSTTSSPVKEAGPGKNSNSPSSSSSPSAARKRAKWAWRGLGSAPSKARAIRPAAGPEARTMPTPPWPGGVATAQMVSSHPVIGTPSGLGLFAPLDAAGDQPLLANGKDVVGHPVQHQASREEHEEYGEDDG